MSTTQQPGSDAGFDGFLELLEARLSLSLDGATPDDRLVDDLGLDSIALFELFVLLEDTARRDLPVELVDSVTTLADVWHWHSTLAHQRDQEPSANGGLA